MNETITDRQRHRERMTADILQQVRNAVQEELAGAPASVTFEDLEEIEQTVMNHTERVVAALSIQEMASERALLTHIANACASANRLIRERRPIGDNGKPTARENQQ